jgi:hypothetical protein
VDLAADFTADTVDRALGVPSDRLRVLAHAASAPAPAPAANGAPAPLPTSTTTPAPATTATPAPATTPTPAPAATSTPAPATTSTPAPATAAAPAPSAPAAHAPSAATAPASTAPPPPAAPAGSQPVDAATDRGEGEDGYSYLAAHGEHSEPEHKAQWDDDDSYDDGYGQYDGSGAREQEWGLAEDASFPPGFPEPVPLSRHDGEADSSASAPGRELSGVSTRHPYRGLDEPTAAVGQPPPPAPPAPASAAAPGPAAASAPAPAAPTSVAAGRSPLVLTVDQKRALIERIAGAESGTERYGAINADGEYRGRFGPDHPAYHRHHMGLSYGLVQFTQESGNLGRLLVMMRDRDAATFSQIFGDHADELIAVTTAAGSPSSESPDGRSPRTQPVGGHDLWEEPWISRFRQAGDIVAFQAAQNELASSTFLDPMLGFAGDLGLDTDRAVAMVVDRAVQMGPPGAEQWIAAAAGPISTPALRQQALSALGYADLASFQTAWGLTADSVWGPVTHAGLVGALRALGSGSPIPLPTTDQMLDAIVRRAEADKVFWVGRVRSLRTAAGFSDQPYPR